MPRPVQTPSRRKYGICLALLVLLAVFAAWPLHAQSIARGREADVKRLLLPYADEGQVGAATLTRIAIQAERIDLELRDRVGAATVLTLRPRSPGTKEPGTRSFVLSAPASTSPDLVAAADLLRQALLRNDDGTFFARTPSAQARPETAPDPARVEKLIALSLGLWGLLLLAGLVTLWRAPRSRWMGVAGLGWLALTLVAALIRRQVPFAPLHANGHGLEELAVVLGGADVTAATGRFVLQYGAAWLLPLRWLVGVLGPSHDQVGVVSSAIGGLAVAAGTAAAWRISRSLFWSTFACLILLYSPVSSRVGHSESAFVVGQLLVAVALLTICETRRAGRTVFAVAVALVALGHPVGVVAAGGLTLVAWGLQARGLGWRWPTATAFLLLGAASVHWTSNQAGVTDRLTENAQFHVPVPTLVHHYLLWLHSDYAPVLALPIAAVGLWGLRQWVPFPAVMAVATNPVESGVRFSLLLAGTGAMLVASLLVTACISDGLRYQSLLAPLVGFLVAASTRVWSGPQPHRLLAFLAACGLAWGLRGMAGAHTLDSQAQGYVALRAMLAKETGEVVLLGPDRRADGHERVVLELPVGRLSAAGPTVSTLRLPDAASLCAQGHPLPAAVRVWWDPACSADVPTGDRAPCTGLLPFAGETLAQVPIQPLQRLREGGMTGEFHHFPDSADTVVLARLSRARCP